MKIIPNEISIINPHLSTCCGDMIMLRFDITVLWYNKFINNYDQFFSNHNHLPNQNLLISLALLFYILSKMLLL